MTTGGGGVTSAPASTRPTLEFEGKAGLVTGAAGGIGRATAVAFGRAGAQVVIADLETTRERALETVELVKRAGGDAAFVATDVTDEVSVGQLVETAASTFGSLDFAHNNAGIAHPKFIDDYTQAEFDAMIAVDLRGVWLSMKHEIRCMKANGGGAIVNTASVAGIVGVPAFAPYVAAKHGVIGLTRTAAVEYANCGIRVNAVAPAAINTALVASLNEAGKNHLISSHALHRLGEPEEVAEAVVWLSSARSSFVTGTVLPVDGGASAFVQNYDPAFNLGV